MKLELGVGSGLDGDVDEEAEEEEDEIYLSKVSKLLGGLFLVAQNRSYIFDKLKH